MKAITINEKNEKAIREIIAEVNGDATRHTNGFADLVNMVRIAEEHLEKMALPKNKRAGVTVSFHAFGCTKMPNAYKYCRIANNVKLVRRSKDWALVSFERVEIFASWSESRFYAISQEQEAIVLKAFKSSMQYGVVKAQAGKE